MIRPKWSKLAHYIILLTIILFNIDIFIYFTSTNPDKISSLPLFQLDGLSYLNGALEMLKNNHYFLTPDIYHSPGGQIWISWIFRISGKVEPIWIRSFNYFFFILIQLILYLLSKKFLTRPFSLLPVLLLASSNQFKLYIASFQYELLLTLIFTWLFYLSLNLKNIKWYHIFITCLLNTMAFLLRYHFIILGIFTTIWINKKVKNNKMILVYTMTYTLLITMFAGIYYQSIKDGELINESSKQLRWLTPTSDGRNYPYPKELKNFRPGIHYIYQDPLSYVIQMKNRFGFLFSLKKDHFLVESRLESLFPKTTRYHLSILFQALLLLGVIFSITKYKKLRVPYLALSFPIYAPQFIIGSTSRFLMPLLPFHFFLFCLALTFATKKIQFSLKKR